MKVERSNEASGPGTVPMPRRGRVLLGAVAVSLLAACGNLTAGGATGRTTVFVAGDAPDSVAVPVAGRAAPAPGPASGRSTPRTPAAAGPAAADSASAGGGDQPEGELELEFFLSLVTADGNVVPLSKDAAHLHVQFPGTQEQEAASRTVPADDYTTLRVTFTKIDAEVDAGLVVGGTTVTGSVEVELEGDSLVVERPIGLDLRGGSSADLVVDMNASSWLTAVDPSSQVVSGSVVSQMIQVRRR